MQGKTRQAIITLSTVSVICINALANLLPINNQTTAQISDSFPIYFVPAGYVFSIWGLIYALMLLFTYYQAKKTERTNKLLDAISPWYVASSVANILWILLWHYNFPVLSVVVMLVLLLSLIKMFLLIDNKQTDIPVWSVKIPINVYLGWISVATVANISVALYSLGWNGFGLTGQIWTAILIGVVTLLTNLMLLLRKNYVYYLVITWSLLGIAYKFQDEIVIVTAALLAIAVSSTIALITVTKQKELLLH